MIKRIIAMMVAGLSAASTFPPYEMPSILLAIGFALWFYQLKNFRSTFLTFIFGFTYFAILLAWMRVVGVDAWAILAVICASWWVLAAIIIRQLPDTPWWSLQAAMIFSACELLRDRLPFNGFGWGQIGVLAANSPLRYLVPTLGQVGMTFLFALIAAEASCIMRKREFHWRRYVLVTVPLLLVTPIAFYTVHTTTETLRVGLVQGGVVHTGLGTIGPARSVLNNHVAVSLANESTLKKQQLVIWPESSSDLDPFKDTQSREAILSTQQKLNVPLLIGANVDAWDGRIENDSILWTGSSSDIVYQKRRLVPFGEFMPARSLISSYTDRAALMPRDFAPGNHPGSVVVNGIKLNVIICFEVADDSLAFDGIADASATVVHTNNATYQFLGQSDQQLLSAKMRALETQRPVLVVSTSGLSAIVDRYGFVQKVITQSEVGVITTVIEGRAGLTPAIVLHDVEVTAILLGVAWIIFRRVREKRRVAP